MARRAHQQSNAPILPPRSRVAVAAGVAVAGLMVLGAMPAGAGMLDGESCRRIKTEYDGLGGAGIREMLAKGPEWAKTNLTKERMEQVRRYLALEEDIRFRCPLGKARPELEAAESEAGATTTLQPNETVPAAKAPPQPGSRPARKAKSASTEQGSAATAAPVAQPEGLRTEAPRARAAKPKANVPAPTAVEAVAEPLAEPLRKSPR